MCKFCEGGDRKNSGKFAIYMTKWSDGTGTTLSVDFDGFDESSDTDFEVNFCPMCGKQLKQVQESTELTEALETLKDNGYICEATSKEIYNVLLQNYDVVDEYNDSQFRTTFTCKTKGVRKADKYLKTSKGGLAIRKGDQWVLIANDLAEIEDYFANRR